MVAWAMPTIKLKFHSLQFSGNEEFWRNFSCVEYFSVLSEQKTSRQMLAKSKKIKKEQNKISLKFKAGVKKREKSLIEVLTV